MRAVLDPNVLVSAVLSPRGVPAAIVRCWRAGDFELIVSPSLLDEVERVMEYPKLRARIEPHEAQELLALLRDEADVRADREAAPPVQPSDPDDAYLVALAYAAHAALVTGDRALFGLGGQVPVHAPADFLAITERADG